MLSVGDARKKIKLFHGAVNGSGMEWMGFAGTYS